MQTVNKYINIIKTISFIFLIINLVDCTLSFAQTESVVVPVSGGKRKLACILPTTVASSKRGAYTEIVNPNKLIKTIKLAIKEARKSNKPKRAAKHKIDLAFINACRAGEIKLGQDNNDDPFIPAPPSDDNDPTATPTPTSTPTVTPTPTATPSPTNIPPVCSLTADKRYGPAPLSVNFDGTKSIDSDGTIIDYHFDFGDSNSQSSGSSVANHQYQAVGTYTASLVVTDNNNVQSTNCTVLITVVQPYHGSLMSLTVDDHAAYAGQMMTFTLDTKTNQAGLAVEVYQDPSAPDTVTGELPNSVLYKSGVTDSFGLYTFTITVPSGQLGKEYYYEARAYQGANILRSNFQGTMYVPDPVTDATIKVDTGGYTKNGKFTPASSPINAAIAVSVPGDVISIAPGLYPHIGDIKDKASQKVAPQRWVMAEQGYGSVEIKRNPSGGGDTIYFSQASYLTFVDLLIRPSDRAGIIFAENNGSFTDINFLDVSVIGTWNPSNPSDLSGGKHVKWGVLSWRIGNVLWRGGSIENIPEEHAWYNHQQENKIRVENLLMAYLGRTCKQYVNRAGESTGLPGNGDISILNVTCIEPGLGDYCGGGSAFTNAGRQNGNMLLSNVYYEAGSDPTTGCSGTGGLVVYHGSGSQNMNIGTLAIYNSTFTLPPGKGDRFNMQIGASDQVIIQNTKISSDDGYLWDASTVGTFDIDNVESNVTCKKHVIDPASSQYKNYHDFRVALGDQ